MLGRARGAGNSGVYSRTGVVASELGLNSAAQYSPAHPACRHISTCKAAIITAATA